MYLQSGVKTWKALDLAEVGPEDVLVDAGCGDGQA